METEVLESVEGTETICQHPRLTYRRSVLVTDTSDTAKLKVSGISCPDCGLEFVTPTATGFADSATLALVSRERAKEMALARTKSPPATNTPPPKEQPKPDPKKGLCGTEMLSLTGDLGFAAQPGCPCKSQAVQMDFMGVEGCRRRRNELLILIENNLDNWNWRTKLFAAPVALWKAAGLGINPTDPVACLLDLSIDRAEAKMKELP